MENGYSLRFLTEEQRTPEVCLAAIQEEPAAIAYLTDEQRTLEVCEIYMHREKEYLW
jgi:hypothetical protein